jgi:Na+-driven multidrug efflux pump
MTKGTFILSVLFIGFMYIYRGSIAKMFLSIGLEIKQVYISYFLFIALMVVLVFGMLTTSTVHQDYSNVTQGMEKLQKQNERPNPWFDIDTYW